MNFYSKFKTRREKLNSLLCVGLDPEFEKLPSIIQKSENPLFTFCKEIVLATSDYAVAYKPNIAFFERFGSQGILEFEKLIQFMKSTFPEIPIVADCKRGDLANTSKEYAKYYFGNLNLDSITLSPYMGADSIEPFLEYSDHSVFLLAYTSNPSSSDLQKIQSANKLYFYEETILFSSKLNQKFTNQVGIVVGATHPKEMKDIRDGEPEMIFLIPGYGAQGGTLEEIIPACGRNSLINSSRSIIFASKEKDFAEKSRDSAASIHKQMNEYLVNL